MTADQKQKPALSMRRILLVILLFILVIAGGWLTSFLIHFDLNDYRKDVEARLSSLLSLSVQIGDMRYNLHGTNLALRIAGLEIGDPEAPLQLVAPDVLVDLQWQGLLTRKLKFDRVNLTEPRLWIRPASTSATGDSASIPQKGPLMIDQALLYKTRIHALDISRGAIHVQPADTEAGFTGFDVVDVEGTFTGLGLNRTCQLFLKGLLQDNEPDRASPWQLQGEASLDLDSGRGLIPYINLDLELNNLDLQWAEQFATGLPNAVDLTGRSDMQLHVMGDVTESVDFHGTLASRDMTIVPGSWAAAPISVRHVMASGQLNLDEQPGISNMALQLENSRLAGKVQWSTAEQPFFVRAELANSTLEIAQLKQWLPQQGQPWQQVRERLHDQGTIELESAAFGFRRTDGERPHWQLDQVNGELNDLTWEQDRLPLVVIESLPVRIDDNRWQVDKGRWRIGSMPVRMTGQGEYAGHSMTITTLEVAGEAPVESLLDEWQIPQSGIRTAGTMAWTGHLEGPHDNLALDFQADLSDLQVHHSSGLQFTPDSEDRLTLHGKIAPDRLELEHGSVSWAALKGHLSGDFRYSRPDSLVLDAMLAINDLSRLAESLPFLEKLRLRGQAELSILQRGLPSSRPPEMVLTLRDAGLRATRHIADLNKINGRLALKPDGLKADNLRVHLGESPLTVNAELVDFSTPRLSLDVQGAAVRARDIVFPSRQATLRDVEGHLEIDADGLSFAPVNVRLDGGTDASVRGTIDFHPPYNVNLDITSEFARISEVIALWTNRQQQTSTPRKRDDEIRTTPAGQRPEIVINAHVSRGDLYGMSFQEANGVIRPSRRRLIIHPLDFSVGDGYCNAQVLTDYGGGNPSRLRISGHTEDVDALQVYGELLKQSSIVRGRLRGDFYLQGEVGSNFLPSSYGQFNVQIKDGVLRKFHILSKIFSLLNVSQILTLGLPDMDLEGMPYQSLTGQLLLDKGVLKSDDLLIQSKAMNLSNIGQMDLVAKTIDLIVTVQPLGTVDKIISRIPVAGWLLTGENKAFLTAHFSVKGDVKDPTVQVMPLDTLSEPTIGLLKRTLGLPFKLIEDPQILWGGQKDQPVDE